VEPVLHHLPGADCRAAVKTFNHEGHKEDAGSPRGGSAIVLSASRRRFTQARQEKIRTEADAQEKVDGSELCRILPSEYNKLRNNQEWLTTETLTSISRNSAQHRLLII
jgi:hypothetical protein